MKPNSSATVFGVKNVDAALKFYTEILGFTEDFRFGEYAGIKYGEVFIHLSQNHADMKPPGSGAIYIFCDEVDAFYAEIKAKGCDTRTEPQDWPYGMRDFIVIDIDGNQVSFGCESKNS